MNSSNERDFDALKITSVSNDTTVTTNNDETLAAAAAPSVNVSVTDSHLFWRESSDGEFLEKLFENTLLSDSLGKKQDETSSSDFVVDELLAFDNIHLTYPLSTAATSSNSVSSSTASATTGVGSSIHHQHHSHEQSSSSSSTPPPPASSSSSTSLSQQQQQQRLSPPAAYVNNNNDPLLTLNSDLKDTITAIIETQQQDNDRRVDKSPPASSTTTTPTPTPATDQLIENLLTSSDLLISKIELAENNTNTNAEDDKIFKRPSADFILSPPPAPPPTTPSQPQTKQSPPPNEITRTMTTAKKQIKALLRMKKDLDAESPNAATTDKPTTVKTKENKLNKQSNNTNQTANNSNNATTTGKLKRSRRQQRATKMVNGGGGVQQADSPKSSRIIKQSLFDAAAANSGKKSVVDATAANGNVIKELIQPSKQAVMFKNRHSNIEPSTKKFASNAVNLNLSAASMNPNSFLVSTTNQRSNSAVIDFDINAAGGSFEKALNLSLMPPSANSKRDEVDLDIKELSLLDLHSSEDDSTLDFSKRIVKKCIVPSLNSNNNNNTNVPTSANRVQLNLIGGKSPNEKSNIFNEIISKRIKYSNPRVVSQQQQQQQPLAPPPPPPPLQQQSDESTIQYITLVDGATPSTSLQIHQQQQKHKKDEPVSYSDWAFSPPSPSNTKAQIKRKKKDPANSASPSVEKTPQSDVVAEQAANKSSLENDTLQHMKNLDLNNEFGRQQLYSTAPTTSSSSNSSSSSNELLSKQLNLNDVNARNQLWNMLRTHTPADELVQRLGAEMHDKITFWDLVQLKLKYSPANSHLKTIYDIIDDYTLLYSNMSSLLERFANEQTFNCNIGNKKNAENSSRSRSSSRNFRKQSTGK